VFIALSNNGFVLFRNDARLNAITVKSRIDDLLEPAKRDVAVRLA